MKAIEKHIRRYPWTQPVTALCIALILLMPNQTVWANITAISADVPRPQPALTTAVQAGVQVLEINWHFTTSSGFNPEVPQKMVAQNTVINNTNGQNVIWCVVVLGGIAAGTYYGMRYLCKQAGLIPTNTPPPPPTNAPPPPPRTNRPPTWTNSTPALTAAAMPDEVFQAFIGGSSPQKPLFGIESDNPADESMYGIASFNSTNWNQLYSSTQYLDPEGNPYIRCLRTSIQTSSTLTGTNWQTIVTTYVWVNNHYVCFSICDPAGTNRENVIIQKDPGGGLPSYPITFGSYEFVIKHSWNTSSNCFFRASSRL